MPLPGGYELFIKAIFYDQKNVIFITKIKKRTELIHKLPEKQTAIIHDKLRLPFKQKIKRTIFEINSVMDKYEFEPSNMTIEA